MACEIVEEFGNGMTKRTTRRKKLYLSEDDDRLEAIDFLMNIGSRLNTPWHGNEQIIADCRARLQEIRDQAQAERGADYPNPGGKKDPLFKIRDSEGWYLREICAYASIVENSASAGRSWEAANRALLIGELLCEYRLSFHWNKHAKFGQERKRDLIEGAKSRRLHSRDVRISTVEFYKRQGSKVGNAIASAAAELGVSVHTIKKDYYAKTVLPAVE